jgi:hypothetical protein
MAPWLQPSRMEAVDVKGMLVVLFAVAGLAYGIGAFLTPQPVISSLPDSRTAVASVDSEDDVDAYGNEVTPAVAEYSLDPAGFPYELHSPQTELPRLGSPKS